MLFAHSPASNPQRDQTAEPVVYQVRCERIQALEEQLRSRFFNDPGFSMSLRGGDERNVYRIAVLAPEKIQREIPDILQRHATLMPRQQDRSSIRISSHQNPDQAAANRSPHPVVATAHHGNVVAPHAGQDGVHRMVPAQGSPAVHAAVHASPNIQTGFLAPNTLPQQPVRRDFAEESRDSYTPTHVPLSKIEQTLRSLLGARFNEMSQGKYLLSVERNGIGKHCTLDVDFENNRMLIVGEKSLCTQLVLLIDAIDQREPREGRERRFLSIPHTKGEVIARIFEVNRSPKRLSTSSASQAVPMVGPSPFGGGTTETKSDGTFPSSPNGEPPRIEFRPGFAPQTQLQTPQSIPNHASRNPIVQLVGYQFEGEGLLDGDFGGGVDAMEQQPGGVGPGMEVVSDFRYQILDDLDVVIIDATGAEVARFADMIREIEKLSKIAEPQIEVQFLRHVNCISLNWVIFQVYIDLFRTKQGTVKVIPLINPNAMLLIGWGHAMEAMKDLIETLDKPVAVENNMLQVIKLKHASAAYVLSVLRGTFPIPPAQNSAFAPRIQMFADSRTNAIIVQAGPNDLKEIERIVAEMDVPGAGPKLQVKTFKLKHTLATDLVQVLTDAISPATAGTSDRKLPALELLVIDEKGRRMIESGIMADVRIARDVRTNSVIVTAPDHCMPLLEELIKMLDVPSATAEIKVFQILYGDANSLIRTLQSLIPSQLEGQVGPQLPGAKDEDAMVPVRFAVDPRTNSILAAGAPNDLKIIEALLYSLDREDRHTRKQTVYLLKSMQAQDVSVAINEYIRSKRTIQQAAPGVVSQYQQIESEVIVIPEHISNSLIVSATPRYYDEIIALIKEIDKSPPQVVIQVLIGEVSLGNAHEFGAEFGIQDSLLFNRSTFNKVDAGTRTITVKDGDVTTVIEEPIAGTVSPGWLFNEKTESSLGSGLNESSLASAGNVGSQLLTNFATGRIGAETGFGGMVFSANSDAVSIMIRALQETNRLEILSRPQITAMNNQKAAIHVGQLVPRIQGTVTTNYSETMDVEDEQVGLMLMVTPSISPEGNVVMLVAAEKSKISSSESTIVGYSNNNPVRSPAIDRIHTMTMISAADNETVVLGGLISKEDQRLHRKVPLLGDIPIVGKLFSYEFNRCKRSELLIIMTPRIVRDGNDMEYIKQVEAARMSWCLGSVARLHGDIGTYNVVAEEPYAGDAEVVFPEMTEIESLTPLEEMLEERQPKPLPQSQPRSQQQSQPQPQPTLAPPVPAPQPSAPTPPKLPTPVLPKKENNE